MRNSFVGTLDILKVEAHRLQPPSGLSNAIRALLVAGQYSQAKLQRPGVTAVCKRLNLPDGSHCLRHSPSWCSKVRLHQQKPMVVEQQVPCALAVGRRNAADYLLRLPYDKGRALADGGGALIAGAQGRLLVAGASPRLLLWLFALSTSSLRPVLLQQS